ncbi:uncharacterized protein LOC103524585 [Diaphorina citri]|uniref:Uncharacterized protein LOC103524585 n=1 Tax=Diaphorina citri TaxID=121845 RepID=A0A1S4ET01_DIACI|nr:uncharacterized protein LOC103524585 [Diaphorina citri]
MPMTISAIKTMTCVNHPFKGLLASASSLRICGSLVIEEERKRVLELKKRVQEEVKMQWENDHRKVCDELLSPSSETNDPPSEDYEKMASDHPLSSSSVSPDSMYSKSITSSSVSITLSSIKKTSMAWLKTLV